MQIRFIPCLLIFHNYKSKKSGRWWLVVVEKYSKGTITLDCRYFQTYTEFFVSTVCITDPVSKLLLREKKKTIFMVTATAPYRPFCSFGLGYRDFFSIFGHRGLYRNFLRF